MTDSLVRFSFSNRLMSLAIGLMIMAGGYYTYLRLPIDAFPDVSPNLVQIFTTTEGLAPEEVEKYVTFPVEISMNGLPGIDHVRSVSNFGLSVVNVYFEDDMDIYLARQLVGERLIEAKAAIPKGFGEPVMGPISTGMGLILFYYLEDSTGTRSLEELRTIQDWIVKFQLQNVKGVTEVLGIGGYEKQFQVIVKQEALLRYGLTITEVIKTIEANNLNVGAQFIEKNNEEYVIRSNGLASGIADIGHIVLKTVDGTPVFLRDIADIVIGGAIRRGVETKNGVGEVVAGMVIKLFGANSSTVISAVGEKLDKINEMLPEGVALHPYYDQKTLVEACVTTVTSALVQGVVLVVFILLLFMGSIRPSIVVALAIPFSVLFAFILMGYFDISANLMSLGGLAIAIGMMVDGAIVMVENVDRRLDEHGKEEGRMGVTLKACIEVARPIAFAIFIIIVVFLPLFTLSGVEGKTFRPLAYTVALAMGGSLLYALLIAPALSSLIMRPPTSAQKKKKTIDEWIVGTMQGWYRPLLEMAIADYRKPLIFSGLLLLAGAFAFPMLGSEFTPKLNEGTIVVRATMAPSISLVESTRTTLLIEKRLLTIPEVETVVSRIGRGEVGAHTDPVNSAEIYVLLKDEDQWESADSQEGLEEVIRHTLKDVPGVMINLTQPIAMTVDELLEGVRAELAIKLYGDDLDTLISKANEISSAVQGVKGATDVQVDQVTGSPQVIIKINRASIARFGVNIAEVQEAISAAIGGAEAGQVFEGVRRFPIYVRYALEDRSDLNDIERLMIRTQGGIVFPLSEVATIKELVGPRQITREQGQRFITVQLNVQNRDIGSFVEEAASVIRDRVKLPSGYMITWGGQFRLQQEANRRLAVVAPITLILIFGLLFSNFQSLRSSFLIILNIPLALVGGVIGLLITGQNLSVPASVGFIALFGIALENGMVLVTYINQLVREGLEVKKAATEGALMRLRPVIMTALTTALGLFPLLFATGTGSEVQRPLATVVIGGLVTSTILTLLVIPAIYKWFAVDITQTDEVS